MSLKLINEGLERILNNTFLDEVLFTDRNNLVKHYIKHIPLTPEELRGSKFERMTVDEYEEAADKLSETPAGPARSETHDVVGFISKNRRYIKYKKSTKEYIIYTPNVGVISYYPLEYESYLRQVDTQFMYEFRENR